MNENEQLFRSILNLGEKPKGKVSPVSETKNDSGGKFDFMGAVKETLNEVPYNVSITENGAIGYKTTGHPLLDINFAASSLRNKSDREIVDMFEKAYYDTPLDSILWLFYLRDVRGGMGERRSFRIILKHMAENHPKEIAGVIPYIAEYGRYDDMWVLLETQFKDPVIRLIKEQIVSDLNGVKENKPISLLGKWLPSRCSKNAKNKQYVNLICTNLGISPYTYQKITSTLRKHLKIVECDMSAGRWSVIDYNKVPAKANLLYNSAFLKHDEERRRSYLEALENHEDGVKINAGTLFPHDIVHKYWDNLKCDQTLEELWKALPGGTGDANIMIVCDGSGSMWQPIDRKAGYNSLQAVEACFALTIYFAERMTGVYKNRFITFGSRPKYISIANCKTLRNKIDLLRMYDDCSSTNVEAVFDMVLETAVNNQLTQEQLPSTVLILSDMEFNDSYACNPRLDATLFGHITKKYETVGYKMPKLAFWNLCSRTGTIPMKQNENGLVLVSGFSPATMKMVMSGNLDPFDAMLDVLYTERYRPIYEAVKGICNGSREMEEQA